MDLMGPFNGSAAGASTFPFRLGMEVTIRRCTTADLGNLEWFGQFTAHRAIIEHAYRRQCCGENVMLLAVGNGFPIAQAWIDLTRAQSRGAGFLWAVRVFPFLQGLGVGRRLLFAAEQEILAAGFNHSELGVELWNEDAKRLYLRLGYEECGRFDEVETYMTPEGHQVSRPMEEILMRKSLVPGNEMAA